ncbi:hypothetical protein OHA61_16570 [Streptomyces sp. NBC_00885]|uniref:hypothetical protein n=1 Tax=Streptomyces sp. NBC_00885 TaxID=2975857 RepID=UPI00386E1E92|nr:hypothetical protein OHA61_16570 [Streptomyces sp. NBC_00885]
MSGTWWVPEAPCAGDLRFTSTDATADTFREPLFEQLLLVCQDCPFRSQCIELVLPRQSLFDGICGGRLWFDGQVRDECEAAHRGELEERGSYINHGTEAGARAHNRRGERACSLCREAGRLAQARRRERKRASGA